MTDSLQITPTERVWTLTLNRPTAANAFNNELYLGLANTIREGTASKECRAMVLTGAGNSFCAGQDLSEMAPEAIGDEIGFEKLIDALSECDTPIIAAVNGVALGIGVTMLFYVDVAFVSPRARFKCPFLPLGVVPEAASSYTLPLLMGRQKAAEFLYTSRWMDAHEAVQNGLALRVVDDAQLLDEAMQLARSISELPPKAVSATKRLIREPYANAVKRARDAENEAFRERFGSAENREAIAAFFEKRKPDFSSF
ncbi:MAG: enoyl-CoA hydratase-related protein [Polyangiales bacterium]